MQTKIILTDIEGTTSSIAFVKEVLFPYASKNLSEFINKNIDKEIIQQQLQTTADTANLDRENVPALIQQLLQWIQEDKKITPLKTLQGLLWQSGYESGDYTAHIYSDAFEYLQQWQQQGLALYVYSSGSIKAQDLFFHYTSVGDIRQLFSGFFDTTSGNKKDRSAYINILQALKKNHSDLHAKNILFLSDILEELNAAKSAGMQTCLITRAEDSSYNSVELNTSHKTAKTFAEIEII